MIRDEAYNGWPNRETWAVAMYINNDQGWQESVHEAIREAWAAGHFSADQPHRVGDIVRENVESVFDLDNYADGGFPRDLQLAREDMGSLWRVDWTAIGASFLLDALEGVDTV